MKVMKAAAKMFDPVPLPRKASREHRKQQMIDATIETLARRGYAQTTMTDVAIASGVSHGLVNFHFGTKEKLLTETLLYLAAEYRENWRDAMAGAAPSPAAHSMPCCLRTSMRKFARKANCGPGAPSGVKPRAARSIRRNALPMTKPATASWKKSARG